MIKMLIASMLLVAVPAMAAEEHPCTKLQSPLKSGSLVAFALCLDHATSGSTYDKDWNEPCQKISDKFMHDLKWLTMCRVTLRNKIEQESNDLEFVNRVVRGDIVEDPNYPPGYKYKDN